MVIITKTFALTRRDYFWVLVRDSLRRSWLVYLLLYLCAAALFIMPSSPSSKIWAVLFLLFPLLLLLFFWRLSGAKAVRLYLKLKHYEIDDEFLTSHAADGSLARIRWDDATKVVATPRCYLLYFGLQFVFLPVDAFSSAEDKTAFEVMLRRGRLTK